MPKLILLKEDIVRYWPFGRPPDHWPEDRRKKGLVEAIVVEGPNGSGQYYLSATKTGNMPMWVMPRDIEGDGRKCALCGADPTRQHNGQCHDASGAKWWGAYYR